MTDEFIGTESLLALSADLTDAADHVRGGYHLGNAAKADGVRCGCDSAACAPGAGHGRYAGGELMHTNGPWNAGFYTGMELPFNICAPDGRVIATVKSEHDRSRIVACVNACAGIPTDWLEQCASNKENDPEIIDKVVAELKQQRDELLEAAQPALEALEDLAEYSSTRKAEQITALRAAIAKVKP
jgi:hypothetical protein